MILNPTRQDRESLSSDQVHDAVEHILLDTFPEIVINGYDYSENDMWDVLLYASTNRISINATCDKLPGAPSCNWIYTFVKQEVLNRYGMEGIERKANESLEDSLPKGLTRSKQKLAVDLVLIPYYGDEATAGVYRSEAKSGTTKFFCFASAYVIKKNKRATICITFVHPGDKLLNVLTRLLSRVEELGIRIKRLLLDRQFAQVAVIRHLSEKPYVSIIAVPKRGKTMKALLHGKKSYRTPYTMRSPEHGEISFPLLIVCRYQKGKAKKHGVEYLTFAVIGECKSCELQIAEEYRQRFGIESSYRMMNQVRARTTSRKKELRLLLVAMAFLLQNIWIWYKWNTAIICRKIKLRFTLTLDIFAQFINHAVEKLFGTLGSINLNAQLR